MRASTVPRSRPPFSMPRAAIVSLFRLYLLIGSVPPILLVVLGPIAGAPHDLLDTYLPEDVALCTIWLLALLFVVRSGRIAGLRLYRGTAFLLVAMWCVASLCALSLALGIAGDGTRHVALIGRFGALGCALCLPLAWSLLRDLKRVRWLDPLSTPDEWEPPLRRATGKA